MIETNIRNGLLYLQNSLPGLNRDELLGTISTLSEARQLTNYEMLLQKIDFDSLTVNQQWQYVKIKQNQKMDYSRELSQWLAKSRYGITGTLYWGEENYYWYKDADATTVLAFDVLQKEGQHEKELKGILQYFLSRRQQGHWQNTVTTASVIFTVLPYLLKQQPDLSKPTLLEVTGDSNFLVRQYPFKLQISKAANAAFTIRKTGQGISYLSFYQSSWNGNPVPDTTHFKISTHFEKNGRNQIYLVSGQKTSLIVEIDALKEADYVMIEIPIPAGCVYASRDQGGESAHREYLKDRIVLFTELMQKGKHRYEVELENRYNGWYTVNPIKVSLMYFPVFYSRNSMKQMEIRDDSKN